MEEALKFIKRNAESMKASMTEQYQKLVDDFSDYRETMEKSMEELVEKQSRLTESELKSASRNPVREAECALNTKNPLKLYDCLIPKLNGDHKQSRLRNSSKSKKIVMSKIKTEANEFYIEENTNLRTELSAL